MNKTLLILAGIICFSFTGFSLAYPVFTPMFLEHDILTGHLSPEKRTILLGTALALYPLGQLIFSPVLGRIADRQGRKKILLASLASSFFCYILMAISIKYGQLWLLLASRFALGVSGANLAIAQSMAADLSTPATKARHFALLAIATNLAWGIGPLMGGMLADPTLINWFSYDIPFWTGAGLAALCVILVFLFLPETRPKTATSLATAKPILALLRDKKLRWLYGISFASFCAIFLFFSFFALYMVETFQTSPAMLGYYVACIAIPMVLSNYLAPVIEKRLGLRLTGIIGHIFILAGVLWFLWPETAYWVLLPTALAGVGITISELATSLAVSNQANHDQQAQAMGIYSSITVAAEMLAAQIGGMLAAQDLLIPFFLFAL